MAEREFSAGGVLVDDDRCVVIVPTRRAANGARVLALPKGHPDGQESAEQAALREVREETGLLARVVEPLGDVRYTYQRSGRAIRKRVEFFLLELVGGDVGDHDDEVEAVRWLSLEEAARTLSYEGEREMVSRALSRSRPTG